MSNAVDDPVRNDPVVARIRAMLAERDPDVLAAVDDVDRTLIVSELRKEPWVRVRESAANALFLERWRQCREASSKT